MDMAERERLICAAAALPDGGTGVRFDLDWRGERAAAFAIRFSGRVHAYLNRCAHVPIELDWMEGQFYDFSGLYLICSTHGAMYLPETGRCVGGPCRGATLTKLAVAERGDGIYLIEDTPSHG